MSKSALKQIVDIEEEILIPNQCRARISLTEKGQ